MSSPLGALQSTERPPLPQRELARLMQEAEQRYGLVVLDLNLITDQNERALVARLARPQRAAKR